MSDKNHIDTIRASSTGSSFIDGIEKYSTGIIDIYLDGADTDSKTVSRYLQKNCKRGMNFHDIGYSFGSSLVRPYDIIKIMYWSKTNKDYKVKFALILNCDDTYVAMLDLNSLGFKCQVIMKQIIQDIPDETKTRGNKNGVTFPSIKADIESRTNVDEFDWVALRKSFRRMKIENMVVVVK